MKTILEHLDQHGFIDDESVGYAKPDEYPFSLEEFREFTDKIWNDAGGWDSSDKYLVKCACFETYYVPFDVEGKKYWLHVMCGQGYAWTLFSDVNHIEQAEHITKLYLEKREVL